jgi:hypothetical protein
MFVFNFGIDTIVRWMENKWWKTKTGTSRRLGYNGGMQKMSIFQSILDGAFVTLQGGIAVLGAYQVILSLLRF